MSFPAYDEYKDSGVDWLGEVPSDWTVTSLKRVSSIYYGIGEPPKYQEEGTRLVRATNVSRGSISDVGMVYVDPTHIPEQRIVWLAEGDIIVVRSGAYTGDSAIIPDGYGEAIAGFDMVMRLHRAFPKFVQYALLSNYVKDFQLQLKRMRAAQPHLNAEELGECVFVAPDLPEQKAIASFLDVETSKIDGLVSEQRRLIELLKEKRQAVISHAVTKGLNPNAPMKPSGIQWLGDVPEHWEMKAFQRCVSIAEGQVDPKDSEYSDMVLIAPNHIESRTGRLLDLENADDQGAISGKYFCNGGDVIYSKIRPALRKVCIAPQDCLCSADMYPLHAHSGLTNDFLFRWILTEQFSAFAVLESDRVAMPKINRESLKQVQFALPPTEEQKEICDHISRQIEGFDLLQAEAERAIELLQERRTALISAAVTGKIDVRGFAPEENVA